MALFGDDELETDAKLSRFKRLAMTDSTYDQRRKLDRLKSEIDKEIGAFRQKTVDLKENTAGCKIDQVGLYPPEMRQIAFLKTTGRKNGQVDRLARIDSHEASSSQRFGGFSDNNHGATAVRSLEHGWRGHLFLLVDESQDNLLIADEAIQCRVPRYSFQRQFVFGCLHDPRLYRGAGVLL